jgi:hypothetical protein
MVLVRERPNPTPIGDDHFYCKALMLAQSCKLQSPLEYIQVKEVARLCIAQHKDFAQA